MGVLKKRSVGGKARFVLLVRMFFQQERIEKGAGKETEQKHGVINGHGKIE